MFIQTKSNHNNITWISLRLKSLAAGLFVKKPVLFNSKEKSALLALCYYSDVMRDAMASQITSLTLVYSTVYSGADERKHQISASLAVNSRHKWLVTGNLFSIWLHHHVRGVHRSPLNVLVIPSVTSKCNGNTMAWRRRIKQWIWIIYIAAYGFSLNQSDFNSSMYE